MKTILTLLCLLIASPAVAVYDAGKVQSVTKNSDDTVTVVANFTGAGEPVAQRSKVFQWNYTNEALAEWSVSTLEKLNGLKTIDTRIKATDDLPVVRPVKPVEEVVIP